MLPINKSNVDFQGPIKRVNFVGRLSREKQPDWIIEVAQKTNLPTRIFGDGLLMKNLKSSSENLKTSVVFYGYVRDPWKYFDNSDILVVPSAFEGDGLVIVEALMRGIPVLLNDIPDLRRFNLPEINYCSSPEHFSKTILNNLNNESNLVVSKSSVDKITKSRDPNFVAVQWVNFFGEIA